MPRPVVLFDIDGTLVDSNYQNSLAWYRAFPAIGLVVPVWRINRHMGMGGDQLVAAVAGQDTEDRGGDELRELWASGSWSSARGWTCSLSPLRDRRGADG